MIKSLALWITPSVAVLGLVGLNGAGLFDGLDPERDPPAFVQQAVAQEPERPERREIPAALTEPVLQVATAEIDLSDAIAPSPQAEPPVPPQVVAERLFTRPAQLSKAFGLTMPLSAAEEDPDAPEIAVASAEPMAPDTPKLQPKDIHALVVRAQALLKARDIAGARLVLQRGADAGDALSTFLLAETYDPLKLAKDPYSALLADPTTARMLYGRAAELANPVETTGSIKPKGCE